MGFDLFPSLTIDASFWESFFLLPIPTMASIIFAGVGWIVLTLFFLKAGVGFLKEYHQNTKGTKDWKWVVLAVDIPALFIQTPKAVEQIFAHLSGALAHHTVADTFWHGKVQKWFSFEIISIEGYIQFLVRTEVEYRDLVEAAIYAQYTEAEITEVEDYVDNIPNRYPATDYDVLGVELKLSEEDAFPIRTYKNFEYNLSKDAVFSDPMAAILENFTRIGHGENLWFQIVIEPVSSHWKEKGIELVKKLIGVEAHHSESLLGKFSGIPLALLKELQHIWHWNFEVEEAHEASHGDPTKLSPGGKATVEAIEEKISKIGLRSKVRFVYSARKEVYNPSRCINGMVGAMNQFHVQDRNGLVPYMSTHAHYDRHHKKSNRLKNTFIKMFKKRKMKWKRCPGYVLNIEELATIWHFPLPFVKTPLLQKAGAKRAEPPAGLPIEWSEVPLKRKGVEFVGASSATAPELVEPLPPENLPYA